MAATVDSLPDPRAPEAPVVRMTTGRQGAPRAMEFISVADLIAEVEAARSVGWLARPVWPADAYGVLGASYKAGKTWLVLDLAVAVAAGKAWLARFPVERQGPVVAFLGEGGKRKMLRRLQAVAEFHDVDLASLPIELCFRAPHLTDQQALAQVREKLAEISPTLVIVDPLYLAARGANGSQLYEMGAHLEQIQALCQEVGSALLVAHHWNRQEGSGASRMSGAGPAEWGRVLVSAEVKSNVTDAATGQSSVTLQVDFMGDEIPDQSVRVRRLVWSDDPDDLNAPLHYEAERLEMPREAGAGSGLPPAARRVLSVLEATTEALTTREIGDLVAADDTGFGGLKARTIQDACKTLERAGLVSEVDSPGKALIWRAHRADSGGGSGV